MLSCLRAGPDRGSTYGWLLSSLAYTIVCCLGMASVGPDRGYRQRCTYGGSLSSLGIVCCLGMVSVGPVRQ